MSGECDKCGSSEHTEATCATYPQDIEGFESRTEFMGRPEWEDGGKFKVQCGLFWDSEKTGFFMRHRNYAGEWAEAWKLVDQHIAACLIREDWRVKLAARGILTELYPDGYCSIYWHDGETSTAIANCGSLDAAQAAGVDALIAEEKDA